MDPEKKFERPIFPTKYSSSQKSLSRLAIGQVSFHHVPFLITRMGHWASVASWVRPRIPLVLLGGSSQDGRKWLITLFSFLSPKDRVVGPTPNGHENGL